MYLVISFCMANGKWLKFRGLLTNDLKYSYILFFMLALKLPKM